MWAGLRASGKGTAILLQEDRVLPCVGGAWLACASKEKVTEHDKKLSWVQMLGSVESHS